MLRDTAVALSTAGIDNVRFEARLLIGHASGLSTEQLVARGADAVPPAVADLVRALTGRRMRREPMAYILGEREFWGRAFKVTPAVLIPRPDSETVIEAVLDLFPDRTRPLHVLDLGVGSGCLLLTVLAEYPAAQGTGLDASPEALSIAASNAASLGVAGRARLIAGDWRQDGWVDGVAAPFDLVLSNPPYIETSAIEGLMPDVGRYEPLLALDGGGDGLDAYRAIATAAPRLVGRDGWLVVEGGAGQAPDIATLFEKAGLSPARFWQDLGGVQRVVAARH